MKRHPNKLLPLLLALCLALTLLSIPALAGTVDSVAVTMTQPAAGDKILETAASFRADKLDYYLSTAVEITDLDAYHENPRTGTRVIENPDETFESGKIYHLQVHLSRRDGDTLADMPSVTINGHAVTMHTPQGLDAALADYDGSVDFYDGCVAQTEDAGYLILMVTTRIPGDCTVTYQPNDPAGVYLTEADAQPLTLTYPAGSEVTVEPTTGNDSEIWYHGLVFQARDGAVFVEWNTAADGSGTAYREGDLLADCIDGDITLYAIWTEAATLSIEKTVVIEDGSLPATYPENFHFELVDDNYDTWLVAWPDSDSSTPLWVCTTQFTAGGRLVPGRSYRFAEDEYSADSAFLGYARVKTEFYWNGSTTPVVWAAGEDAPEIPLTMADGVNTIRVVNTYRNTGADIVNDSLALQHQVPQSDRSGWDGSDTTAHKATAAQPTIHYRATLDLSATTLTEAGKEKLDGYELPSGTIWDIIRASPDDFRYGSFLMLQLHFDAEQLASLSPEDFTGLTLEHNWFELDTYDPAHPEYAVGVPDPDAETFHEFYIYLRFRADADFNAAPDDELTLSGLTLTLQTPLSDADTDRNPRAIRTTARLTGLLRDGGSVMSLDVQAARGRYGDDPLLLSGAETTDTVLLYWTEAKETLPPADIRDEDSWYLALQKQDADDGSALRGAKFGLFQNDRQIATAISGADGYAYFRLTESAYRALSDGDTLYYQELTAPGGYALDSQAHAVRRSDFFQSSAAARKAAAVVGNHRSTAPDGLNAADHVAYVQGYEDGTVRPGAPVTRAETAAMLYRLLTDARRAEIRSTTHRFTDVSAANWYQEAVASMARGGYLTGYADGSFGGDRSITRAEFVAMLTRFLGQQSATCSFSDVDRSHWAYDAIAAATASGWITGYADGSFRPDQSITRAEAMAILNRVLNRGVDEHSELPDFRVWPDNEPTAWYYYEVIEATNGHLYTGARPSEDWTALLSR